MSLDYGEFGGTVLRIPTSQNIVPDNVVVRSFEDDEPTPKRSRPGSADELRRQLMSMPPETNDRHDVWNDHDESMQPPPPVTKNGRRHQDLHDELIYPPSSPPRNGVKRQIKERDEDADTDDKLPANIINQIEESHEKIEDLLRDTMTEMDRLRRHIRELKRGRNR